MTNDSGWKRESLVRWQRLTIDQLSYAQNLLLTLSAAGLAFIAQLVFLSDTEPASLSLLTCSAMSFVFSVLVGLLGTLSRLLDFRLTAQIALSRHQGGTQSERDAKRIWAKRLSKATWWLFWALLVAFSASIVLLAIALFKEL